MKWNWRVCENRKTSSVLQQQETTTSCRGQSETSVQITKRLGFANTSYNIFHFSAVNDCFGCDSDEKFEFRVLCTILRLSRHASSLVFAAIFSLSFELTFMCNLWIYFRSSVSMCGEWVRVSRTYLFFARLWMAHDGYCVLRRTDILRLHEECWVWLRPLDFLIIYFYRNGVNENTSIFMCENMSPKTRQTDRQTLTNA